VRDANHGDAFTGHLYHHVQHFLDHFGVQRRGGFVKQHDFWFQAQRAGYRHPLLLSARELQGVFPGLLRNAHALELLHRLFFGLLFGNLAHPHRRQRQVFEHAQVREQVELLKHHADFLAHIVNRLDVVGQLHAIHRQASLLMFLKPVDAADQR